MVKYLKYLWYIIRHKWYVGIECLKRGLWWQAITHDLSKLRWDEFKPYAKWFYLWRHLSIDNRNIADLKHQHRNPHHWQYWILKHDAGYTTTLQMPDKYVKEMVCDWIGTGKAESKAGIENVLTWYEINKDNLILHPASRAQVRRLLGVKKKLRNKINDLAVKPTDNFPTSVTIDATDVNAEEAIKTYDYITDYEDEVIAENGTLTSQQIAEMDVRKRRMRAEQLKQVDEQQKNSSPQNNKRTENEQR